MRVAILAPGPSLSAFQPDSGELFDCIIGINRAATVHRCDWWSVGDDQAFWRHIHDPDNEKQGFVIGRPRVVTMSPTWALVYNNRRGLYDEFPEWMIWEKLRDLMLPPPEWDCWSSVVGLVLAGHLGASETVSYGVDFSGDHDFAGFVHGGRYNQQRWDRERIIWQRVSAWLAETRACQVVNGAEVTTCAA